VPRFLATPTLVALWLGLLAVVVGLVFVLTAPPSASGWFAYAPLSDYAFVGGSRPWQLTVGPVLVLVGAVVAAFALGRLSTRRRS
jgi:heme/copper-type cytochrome/quinol oxidase subunit 1